jgi:hypothetical protein
VFSFTTHPALLQLVNVTLIRHIFIDRTHGIGPCGTQVLTVLGLTQYGIVVPLGYCVTNGATANHYLFLLDQLAGMGLNPTHVHVDYERPEQTTIGLAWPRARVVGCFFHFLQANRRQYEAWCRKIRQKDKIWTEIHRYLCLIYKSTTTAMVKESCQQLQKFCGANNRHNWFRDYFYATWVKKFLHRTWSMAGETDPAAAAIRTNNFVKVWNHHLKSVTFDHVLNQGLDKVAEGLYKTMCARHTQLCLQIEKGLKPTDADFDEADFAVGSISNTYTPEKPPATFERDFAANNLRIVDNPGRGFCQQHAVADALGEANGGYELRAKLLQFLGTNDRFRQFAEDFLDEELDGSTWTEFVA